jgi:hypothetical protein
MGGPAMLEVGFGAADSDSALEQAESPRARTATSVIARLLVFLESILNTS